MPTNHVSIRPELVPRQSGGWLAVSPRFATIMIGVTAASEDEARELFAATYAQWLGILASGGDPQKEL